MSIGVPFFWCTPHAVVEDGRARISKFDVASVKDGRAGPRQPPSSPPTQQSSVGTSRGQLASRGASWTRGWERKWNLRDLREASSSKLNDQVSTCKEGYWLWWVVTELARKTTYKHETKATATCATSMAADGCRFCVPTARTSPSPRPDHSSAIPALIRIRVVAEHLRGDHERGEGKMTTWGTTCGRKSSLEALEECECCECHRMVQEGQAYVMKWTSVRATGVGEMVFEAVCGRDGGNLARGCRERASLNGAVEARCWSLAALTAWIALYFRLGRRLLLQLGDVIGGWMYEVEVNRLGNGSPQEVVAVLGGGERREIQRKHVIAMGRVRRRMAPEIRSVAKLVFLPPESDASGLLGQCPPCAVYTRLQRGFRIASSTKDGVGRLDQHGNAVLPPRLHYAVSPQTGPPPPSAPGDVCIDVLKKVRSRLQPRIVGSSSINWENLEVKEEHLAFVLDNLRQIFITWPASRQMKKANFDISHKLAEFLMVDKPLTAHKHRANLGLEKMELVLGQEHRSACRITRTTSPSPSPYMSSKPGQYTTASAIGTHRTPQPNTTTTSTRTQNSNPPPSHTYTIGGDVDGSNHGRDDGHGNGSTHGIATHTYLHAGPGGRTTVLAMHCSSSTRVPLLPPTISTPSAVAQEKRTPGVTILD
ncbi:hypothetical protein BD410DRAFT_877237 [Rickenella mellea]|uniref:Uncharacterized protein n=1 Tax=Rickenella mellea TaxID=50990 RepID=A0A4Y7PEN3_9AGAM|nr:hypothetical protein BD410DRAFT_877237 [Rickenella mellea]